jgi:putative membrane protein
MGPEKFFSSGMWIIPLVMMILCFIFFRTGIGRNLFTNSKINKDSDDQHSSESALNIIKMRYAKGEISKAEYDEMKDNI